MACAVYVLESGGYSALWERFGRNEQTSAAYGARSSGLISQPFRAGLCLAVGPPGLDSVTILAAIFGRPFGTNPDGGLHQFFYEGSCNIRGNPIALLDQRFRGQDWF
jgi:hypothetical protein